MSDWIGNRKSVYRTIGASSHSEKERETNDYYATDPYAIDVLINDAGANLAPNIWEVSCGEGHLSKRLEEYGYNVKSTDLQIDFVGKVLHIPNFLLSLQNRKNYYRIWI